MTLKERCRLTILSCIKRDNYSLISSLPLPSSLLLYISNGREWDSPPTSPKKLCPLSEEDMKQRPVNDNEIDQRRMFVVDSQQQYLLVNCRGAVLMQLPLRRSSDAEDNDDDDDDGQGYNMEEGNSQEEYKDQDDEYYDPSSQDGDEVLEGSMESLHQYT